MNAYDQQPSHRGAPAQAPPTSGTISGPSSGPTSSWLDSEQGAWLESPLSPSQPATRSATQSEFQAGSQAQSHAQSQAESQAGDLSISAPPSGFGLAGALSGLAVFGVLWVLSLIFAPMLVAGGAVACTAVGASAAVAKVKRAGEDLGWRIRDEDDLAVARGVAEMDMKAAAVLMARLWSVLLFCLASGEVTIGLTLVLFCVLFGPLASAVEGRFRNMETDDPDLRRRRERINTAWKEPRWKLPQDV